MPDATNRLIAALETELTGENLALTDNATLAKLSALMVQSVDLVMDEQEKRLARETDAVSAALITAAKRAKGITDH